MATGVDEDAPTRKIGLSITVFGFLITVVSHPEFGWKQFLAGTVFGGLFCLIIGSIWGYLNWKSSEERYAGGLKE